MIQFASTTDGIPSTNKFIEWINNLSKLIELNKESITVRVVDEAESQTLNQQFRGKDKPTNVLSFPAETPDFEAPYLGDIVICAPVVAREAKEQNKLCESHWAHMLVHGILHLQGYDHIEDQDAEEMEALEVKLLAGLGFTNPYE